MSSEGIINVGVEPALCVQVNDSFGVVCIGHQGIYCATCRNCKHVDHLVKVLQEIAAEEMLPQFKPFADFKPKDVKPSVCIKAVSDQIIPFNLPRHLQQSVMDDYSKRFNLIDGVAHLIPSLGSCPLACSLCGGSWSEEVFLAQDVFLVAHHCCYPAKGTANYTLMEWYFLCTL